MRNGIVWRLVLIVALLDIATFEWLLWRDLNTFDPRCLLPGWEAVHDLSYPGGQRTWCERLADRDAVVIQYE